ncbi:MAG: nucleotide exchange factor GrpE [Oscillospiraceae bacterium]|nr:nucleotide exchange factor GrpE [Oscillospiraceae bacterium]
MNTDERNNTPAEESAPETETAPAPETAAPETPAAETPEPSSPEEALRKELAEAKAAIAEDKDKYLRLLAEYDNFRKRSSRERDNIYADVKADTIAKLLPVYDNLERALKQETADEAYRKGVEMTMNQFMEVLKGLGVTPIEALGKTFDPKEHNAVMHLEDPEKGEQEITAEFQKGFRMGERVIRFSMVQVAN